MELRANGAEFKVVKMTLARRAADALEIDTLDELLLGPTGLAFADGDPVGAAKVLKDFAKDHDVFVVKGGLLDLEFLTPEKISELADIEPREVLLAKLAGAMKAPMSTSQVFSPHCRATPPPCSSSCWRRRRQASSSVQQKKRQPKLTSRMQTHLPSRRPRRKHPPRKPLLRMRPTRSKHLPMRQMPTPPPKKPRPPRMPHPTMTMHPITSPPLKRRC